MTGAKSAHDLCSALVYSADGDDPVIIASKGGAPTYLNWYHNLVADPTCTAEVGTDKYEPAAVLTNGDERKRLFDAQVAIMPGFAQYEIDAAQREILLFRLNRSVQAAVAHASTHTRITQQSARPSDRVG